MIDQGIHERLDAIAARLDALVEGGALGPPRFLTIGSAARHVDLSADSIRRLIEGGRLRAYRPVRGRVVVDRQELQDLILSSTTRPRNGRGHAVRKRAWA